MEIRRNHSYQGDCLDLMWDIPDQSIDMIFTDLPYGTTQNPWDLPIPLDQLYRIAKEHYDKAIHLLQKATGIHITLKMAEVLAENYASLRVYNYIDATVYNIPWYLIYGFNGFPLYHMLVRKDTTLYRELKKIGIQVKDSRREGYVYVEEIKGYLLIATNYRYKVDANESLNEWLDFSILRPDNTVKSTLLYEAIGQFLIRVDSYYFSNLVHFESWKSQQKLLDIAEKYMNP